MQQKTHTHNKQEPAKPTAFKARPVHNKVWRQGRAVAGRFPVVNKRHECVAQNRTIVRMPLRGNGRKLMDEEASGWEQFCFMNFNRTKRLFEIFAHRQSKHSETAALSQTKNVGRNEKPKAGIAKTRQKE
jgi:hypothetical protein